MSNLYAYWQIILSEIRVATVLCFPRLRHELHLCVHAGKQKRPEQDITTQPPLKQHQGVFECRKLRFFFFSMKKEFEFACGKQ